MSRFGDWKDDLELMEKFVEVFSAFLGSSEDLRSEIEKLVQLTDSEDFLPEQRFHALVKIKELLCDLKYHERQFWTKPKGEESAESRELNAKRD